MVCVARRAETVADRGLVCGDSCSTLHIGPERWGNFHQRFSPRCCWRKRPGDPPVATAPCGSIGHLLRVADGSPDHRKPNYAALALPLQCPSWPGPSRAGAGGRRALRLDSRGWLAISSAVVRIRSTALHVRFSSSRHTSTVALPVLLRRLRRSASNRQGRRRPAGRSGSARLPPQARRLPPDRRAARVSVRRRCGHLRHASARAPSREILNAQADAIAST